MARALKDSSCTEGERRLWEKNSKVLNQSSSPGLQETLGVLKHLADDGWLPKAYTGTTPHEFWADMFAIAIKPDVDSSRAKEKHYGPIVLAIRTAITQGKTPKEIRQLFLEQLAGNH